MVDKGTFDEAKGRVPTRCTGICRLKQWGVRVGTSGSTLERVRPVVPIAFSLPARTFGAMVVIASIIMCTWAPRMPARAPSLPL